MTQIVKKFSNSMTYSSLYGFLLKLYEKNGMPKGNELYLYNTDTNVMYLFDYRVYYTKIGYLKTGTDYNNPNNYLSFELPNESYQDMPGRTNIYAQTQIMTALHQPQNYYFKGTSLNTNEVDRATRAIALLSEALRFKTIHIALINSGMKTEKWEDSWATLALNWAAITNNQFTIPVLEVTVCDYMKNSASTPTKTAFVNSINKYLGTKACKF